LDESSEAKLAVAESVNPAAGFTEKAKFDKVADNVTVVNDVIESERSFDAPIMVAETSFISTTGNPVKDNPKLFNEAPESSKSKPALVVAPERNNSDADPEAESSWNTPPETFQEMDPSVKVSQERPMGAFQEPTILPSNVTKDEDAPE
jgi:hypothetical protein